MPKRLASMLLLSVMASSCGPAPLEPRDPTPGVPHFWIATFNVHYPTAGDDETVSAVAATRADVVFLQETDASWRQALAGRFGREYPHRWFTAEEGPRGLGVLSRFPIEQRQQLAAPENWHPAQRLVLRTPAGSLQVLHVHLRSRFEGTGNPASNFLATSKDHIVELEAFWATRAEMPTLIAGDFNEEPDGLALEWLEQRGFRNVLPLYHPGQGTWQGRSIADQFSMTIDHILFDSWLEPLNAGVSPRGNSDHAPVVAHFEAARRFPDADAQN